MPGGSQPTLVNQVHTSYGLNGQTDFSINIPDSNLGIAGAPGGNCIIAIVQGGTEASTYTMSDNKGNTWTTIIATVILNGQNYSVFAILNCISGTQNIKCTPNTPDSSFQMHVLQYYNVALSSAADGSSTNGTTAPNLTAGSFTPTTAGDLIIWAAANTSVANPGLTSGFTAGSSGTLLCNNSQEALVVCHKIHPTATAINAAITAPGTDGYGVLAFALKGADAGTAPDLDRRIIGIYHTMFNGSAFTSCKVRAPIKGDAVASLNNTFNITGTSYPTAVSDDQGNTWKQVAGSPELNSPSGGTPSIWYKDDPNFASNMVITFTMNAATSNVFGQHFILYDMLGVRYDTSDHADGNQQVTADLTSTGITPTQSPGIALCVCGIDAHTLSGLVGAGFVADMVGNSGADGSDGTANSDNGWGHVAFNSNTRQTFVWTSQPAGNTGVQHWSAIAATFTTLPKAPNQPATSQISLGMRAMR